MNDDKKAVLRFIAIVGGVLLLAAVLWYLFRDYHADTGRGGDIRESLERTSAEQRNAVDASGRIRDGLDESRRSLERIEESNSDAESAVTDADGRISAAIVIIEDGQRRIAESIRILQTARERARPD